MEKFSLRFDENFPVYHEDVDLGMRIQKLGLKIYYNPRMKVEHTRGLNFSSLMKREFLIGRRTYSLENKWHSLFSKQRQIEKLFADNKKARMYFKKLKSTTNIFPLNKTFFKRKDLSL